MMDELAALRSAAGYTGPCIVKLGAGTYLPEYEPMVPAAAGDSFDRNPPVDSRDAAFILRPGVQVWGGHNASPTDGDTSRNPAANITTLSGDLDSDDAGSIFIDNAYHVVLAVNIPANDGTVLDGLTISGGCADDGGSSFITVDSASIYRSIGGGMFNWNSSLTLVNVNISGNTASGNGGGIYNNSSPLVLVNAVISGNTTDTGGGGMYNINSSPTIVNVNISGNSAGNGGGGMYNGGSSLVLINAVISGNSTGGFGGGMWNSGSSPEVRNSIIWGNTAPTGPGIYNGGSTPLISYSIVQGSGGSLSWVPATGTDGGNNKDTDPLFVGGGDYHLQSTSLEAIDAGNDALYPLDADAVEALLGQTLSPEAKTAINAALSTDLDGSPRKQGTIDMGPYER
jgi:hypothetical protein